MAALSVDILKAAGSRVSSPFAVPREAGLDCRVVDVLVRKMLDPQVPCLELLRNPSKRNKPDSPPNQSLPSDLCAMA